MLAHPRNDSYVEQCDKLEFYDSHGRNDTGRYRDA